MTARGRGSGTFGSAGRRRGHNTSSSTAKPTSTTLAGGSLRSDDPWMGGVHAAT